MSGTSQAKKEDSSDGIGVVGTLVVAGGAAVIGFASSLLLSKWKEIKFEKKCRQFDSSQLHQPTSSSQPHKPDLSSQLRKPDSLSQPQHPDLSSPPYKSKSLSWSQEEQEKMKDQKEFKATAKDELEAVQCIICLSNKRNIILEPCNHVCLCKDCAEQICKVCPVCRGQIKNKKVVYISS